MKTFKIVLFVAALITLSYAENLPTNPEEALAKVNQIIDIPELKNLNVSQLPIAAGEDVARKKCEQNGGVGAYDAAKQGGVKLYDCVKDLVNFTVLQDEMEKARPTGDLDEVFKKYCNKKSTLKKCLANFTMTIEPCLDEQERVNRKIVHNITEKILNFICFKEGDRIALFIAAKGPQCFQSKANAIQDCANATYGEASPSLPFNVSSGLSGLSGLTEVKNLPRLVFDAKTCKHMGKFQTCVVAALEGCDDPTPSNLLDSIFNYIKKVTPCEKMLADEPPPQSMALTAANSATRNFGVTAVIIASLMAIL